MRRSNLVFTASRYNLKHLRVPTKGSLEEFFFQLINGSRQTLWLIAGDQDGGEKSLKSVHDFINIFPTIYFLGKINLHFFAKMGHPNRDCLNGT